MPDLTNMLRQYADSIAVCAAPEEKQRLELLADRLLLASATPDYHDPALLRASASAIRQLLDTLP